MKNYIIAPSASRDLKKLANFPNMGKSYSHINPSLRGLPLKGYIVFYRIVNDTIEILRVVSGRQDLESLFSEDI